MEYPSRPGPSRLGTARPLHLSPGAAGAAVMPNILRDDQVIQPLTAEDHNIQVAVLTKSEHGEYHFQRTAVLLINKMKTQALDPSAPVPIALPNEHPINNIATVLRTERMRILPNITNRHEQLLNDLDRDELRIPPQSWAIQELVHRRPTARWIREWTRMLQAIEQGVEVRLPQALDERYGPNSHPSFRPQPAPPPASQHASQPAPQVVPEPVVPHSYMRGHIRPTRRRRSRSTPPLGQRPAVFSNSLQACLVFLGQLRSAARGHPRLERALRAIVQLMVDDVLSPKQFCRRLDRFLGVTVQPYLVRFLKNNMHRLRQWLYLDFVGLEGIERPEHNVVFPIPAPLLEMPTVVPMGTAGRMEIAGRMGTVGPMDTMRRNLPIAAVAPLQTIPLSNIPYDMPIPLAPIHVWQVEREGLPALSKTTPKEGDVHLYNPSVGYVHLRVMPTANSFQIGDTTITLLPKKTVPLSQYQYTYRY